MKKLQTTTNQFHDMHVVVDKARPKTRTVTVEKDALFNLLVDHSKMVGELQINMSKMMVADPNILRVTPMTVYLAPYL